MPTLLKITNQKRQLVNLPVSLLHQPSTHPRNYLLKVYMDNDDKLKSNLTDETFQIVQSSDEADILWFDSHVDNFQ